MCIMKAVPVPDDVDISQSHDRTVDNHHEVAASSNDSSGVEGRRQLVDRFRH